MQGLPGAVFAHPDIQTLSPVIRRVCRLWRAVTTAGTQNHWYRLAMYCSRQGYVALLDWMWSQQPGNVYVYMGGYVTAARAGHMPVIHWLQMRKIPVGQQDMMACEALIYGHTSIVRSLCEIWPCNPRRTMNCAISAGDVDLCMYLHEQGHTVDELSLSGAACSGSISMMQWVKSMPGQEYTGRELNNAVCYGHREMAEWITLQDPEQCTSEAWEWAVLKLSKSSADMLVWLSTQTWAGPPTSQAMETAVRSGRLSAIQWFHRYGCPWLEEYTHRAAREGHVHVLRWVAEQGLLKADPLLAGDAIMSGSWNTWRWALEQGYPPLIPEGCEKELLSASGADMRLVYLAIREWTPALIVRLLGGSYETNLRDMYHRSGDHLPWDVSVSMHLAQCRLYRTLRWAIEQGCPWDAAVRKECEQSQDPTLLPWLDARPSA